MNSIQNNISVSILHSDFQVEEISMNVYAMVLSRKGKYRSMDNTKIGIKVNNSYTKKLRGLWLKDTYKRVHGK